MIGDVLVAVIAMVPAYIIVSIWINGYVWVVDQHWIPEMVLVGLFFLTITLLVIKQIPMMKRDNQIEWQVLAIPIFFYTWSIFMLYISGFYNKFQELVLVFPAFIILGLLGFCLPFLSTLLIKNEVR